MDKYCKAIELDKILARLAQLCSCEDAKAMALAIEPARDLRDVRELMPVHGRREHADQPLLHAVGRRGGEPRRRAQAQ